MKETERIDYLINTLEYGSAKAFARKTGMTESTVSYLRRGMRGMKSAVPKIIAAYPQVNENWLLTGEGPSGVTSVGAEKLLREKDEIIATLSAQIRSNLKRIAELESKLR